MMSLCDGCSTLFKEQLEIVTAKKWQPHLCNISEAAASTCTNTTCDYNLAAECCVEYMFCHSCLSNKALVDAKFNDFLMNK